MTSLLLHHKRYTQKQLYDVVSDTDSYHRFLPFCTSSRVVSRPPPGAAPSVPTKVELSVGFMGVEQSYISDVFCTPNERVEVRPVCWLLIYNTL